MEKASSATHHQPLPPIPAKRYFTIGEVSDLCQVKPYVLRYWEQEFTQLKPMKRRGNRRYYQHHEVLLIRRIRDLLYEQGFTISGARNRLTAPASPEGQARDGLRRGRDASATPTPTMVARTAREIELDALIDRELDDLTVEALTTDQNFAGAGAHAWSPQQMRTELMLIRRLLGG
jgi:DNA-binding transcriptional MerR regulator